MGACMYGPATVGIFFGDITTNNSASTEATLRRKYDALENTTVTKLHNLYQATVALSLSNRVKFYNFFPGREIAYFDQNDTYEVNQTINSILSGDDQVIASIAAELGYMGAMYVSYRNLSEHLAQARRVGHPNLFNMEQGITVGQQCMMNIYMGVSKRVARELSDMGFNKAPPPILPGNVPDDELSPFISEFTAYVGRGIQS
jgi:hypothetical protein